MFTFIESSVFERVRAVYFDDHEYAELQQFIMADPGAGKPYLPPAEFENCAGDEKVRVSAVACG